MSKICEEKVLINSFVDIILENFEGEGEILTKVISILHHSLIEKVAFKPLQWSVFAAKYFLLSDMY